MKQDYITNVLLYCLHVINYYNGYDNKVGIRDTRAGSGAAGVPDPSLPSCALGFHSDELGEITVTDKPILTLSIVWHVYEHRIIHVTVSLYFLYFHYFHFSL